MSLRIVPDKFAIINVNTDDTLASGAHTSYPHNPSEPGKWTITYHPALSIDPDDFPEVTLGDAIGGAMTKVIDAISTITTEQLYAVKIGIGR